MLGSMQIEQRILRFQKLLNLASPRAITQKSHSSLPRVIFQVQEGDRLAEIHHNGNLSAVLRKRIEDAFLIGHQETPLKRVIAVVSFISVSISG